MREPFLAMVLRPLERDGITLERLKAEQRVFLSVEPVPWRDRRFQTPSGKYELISNIVRQKGMDGVSKSCIRLNQKNRIRYWPRNIRTGC
ncbi:hypothetical protein [Geobacillus thermodenitrificans]|uniref:hypothetical protein n=1 Tax=Geobacillus thermodenitrificans TaxID=33940 RepID=UPI00399C83DB